MAAPKKNLLIGLGIGLGLLFFYGPGLVRWAELHSRETQLRQEMRTLALQNRWLVEEARRLREDLSYAEAMARGQLGLVRPGETKIKFQKAGK